MDKKQKQIHIYKSMHAHLKFCFWNLGVILKTSFPSHIQTKFRFLPQKYISNLLFCSPMPASLNISYCLLLTIPYQSNKYLTSYIYSWFIQIQSLHCSQCLILFKVAQWSQKKSNLLKRGLVRPAKLTSALSESCSLVLSLFQPTLALFQTLVLLYMLLILSSLPSSLHFNSSSVFRS